MVRNIKNVLVGLTKEFGPEETSSALGYGLDLARSAGAHLTVQAASAKLVLTSGWITSVAGSLVAVENRRLGNLAQAAAQAAQADAAAAGVICTTLAPQLSYLDLLASFTAQARLHDLTVLDAEPEALSVDRGLIETLLTQSGRPLLVVPPGRDAFKAERILVAWDGSAKAARAVADARPLLQASTAVEIVSVTGEKELPGEIAGADIAPTLVRHGIPVTVTTLSEPDGDVAEALRTHARRRGADMIVMGGFVHARLQQLVFGGVTQSLLASCPVPLFMAH